MFKNNGGEDFLDQIKWAHDQGFRAIEDNGMMDDR
jgi:hydroxypyruvate isomerase